MACRYKARGNRDKTLVSVIVPVRNAEPYLARCIDSILSQTYGHLELLVVDNGSTDSSLEIVRLYEDGRIRILDAGDRPGVSHARNVGLNAARGRFVAFVDADDYVSPSYLHEAVEAQHEHGLDIVFGGTTVTYPGRVERRYSDEGGACLVYQGSDIAKVIYCTVADKTIEAPELDPFFTCACWCQLINRDLCCDERFDEGLSIGEDTVFNVSLLRRAKRVGIVDRPWYHWVRTYASATGGYSVEREPDVRRMLERLWDLLRGDPVAAYYWHVRAMQQLDGLLARMCNSESEHIVSDCLSIALDPFWRNAASGFPFLRADFGKKTKLLVPLIRARSSTLIRVYLKALSWVQRRRGIGW